MKRLHCILFFLWFVGIHCQEPSHNFGNLKIHDGGSVGFFHDFINDGITDDNKGIAGFYSDNNIIISGAFRPIFNDMEVVVNDDLIIDVGVGITNNANFVLGDVKTPRNLVDVNLDFITNAFYTGDTNLTKVDGYAGASAKQNFVFPIGDADKLRPLELFSENVNTMAKSAYFFEDPNFPSTFITSFNTNNTNDILTAVSTFEFWDLDTDILSRIRLTWDSDSNLGAFVDAFENLRIVGWHTQNAIWENLGGNNIVGDYDAGEIVSDLFVPDDYSIITFGSSLSSDNLTLDNYHLSPDGDGTNDVLYFEALSLSPVNNSLHIYNRWGRLVYSAEGYQNNFEGISENSATIAPNTKLPDGVYFYILKLRDINLVHQGYLALTN